MLVYNYNPITFEYIGCEEADESPLERGVFLLPAHATFIEQELLPVDGKMIIFDITNQVWIYKDIPLPEEKPKPKLEDVKMQMISSSKANLEGYINSNPITSTCHGGVEKKYSITREKQSLLAQMIIMTQLAMQNNIPYQPSWNATGEPCSYDWTIAELQQLAFEIESVVRPLISKQQKIEVDINACTTVEEVMAIDITI